MPFSRSDQKSCSIVRISISQFSSMTCSVDTLSLCSVVRCNTVTCLQVSYTADGDNIEASSSSSSMLDGDEVNNAHYCTARFAQLVNSEKFSDVTLVVGGRQYRCHRLLLAVASPVLESVVFACSSSVVCCFVSLCIAACSR